MSNALDKLEAQLMETINHKQLLREALLNSHSLLSTLGSPDDPIVQTALNENERAFKQTGYWSDMLSTHYRSGTASPLAEKPDRSEV